MMRRKRRRRRERLVRRVCLGVCVVGSVIEEKEIEGIELEGRRKAEDRERREWIRSGGR